MIDETDRKDMGIICGLNFPILSTGLIDYVMMNSSSIGVVIKKMCIYQKLIGDSTKVKSPRQPGLLFLTILSNLT